MVSETKAQCESSFNCTLEILLSYLLSSLSAVPFRWDQVSFYWGELCWRTRDGCSVCSRVISTYLLIRFY